MGAVINRGVTTDLPADFVGVGIDSGPNIGFVRSPEANMLRSHKRPLYGIDFVNKKATKGGAKADYAAVLAAVFPAIDTAKIINGQGYTHTKVAGQAYPFLSTEFGPTLQSIFQKRGARAFLEFESKPIVNTVGTTWFAAFAGLANFIDLGGAAEKFEMTADAMVDNGRLNYSVYLARYDSAWNSSWNRATPIRRPLRRFSTQRKFVLDVTRSLPVANTARPVSIWDSKTSRSLLPCST